ncbi:MAG: hypothetical protein FK733_06650 [Asgard group archaeon]|nr:hypothetical protein [Asgard group archaeon]
MNKKKILAIFIPVSALLIMGITGMSVYIHLYVGYRNVHFEQNINSIDPADLGVNEWLSDFNSFYSIIEENYPYLDIKERRLDYNWLDLKNQFVNRIENCSSNEEFFAIMSDAVRALQNEHTYILNPNYIELFREVVFTDFYPYSEIFTEQIQEANNYWKPIYDDFNYTKYDLNFDVLIVYDRGDYRIVNGTSNWTDKYSIEPYSKIIAVNDTPIDLAINDCYEKSYINWDFQRNKNYVSIITPFVFNSNAEFTVQNATSLEEQDITFDVQFQKYINPFNYTNRLETLFWPEDNACYINMNSFAHEYCNDDEFAIIENFYDQINSSYDYLLVDIRGNGGGNGYYWTKYLFSHIANTPHKYTGYYGIREGTYVNYFRKAMEIYFTTNKNKLPNLPAEVLTIDFKIYTKNYYNSYTLTPQDSIGFDGEVILLTDEHVYSSAEALAMFCKDSGFATIYGTHTGGDGNGMGIYYTLPNSKLIISFAGFMGIDSTGQANEEMRTAPDVFFESAYGNQEELIDFVLDNLP